MSEPVVRPSEDDSLREALDRIAKFSVRTVPVGMKGPPGEASTVVAASLLAAAAAGRRPWLRASASLLVWGAGQWLNGQRALGLLFFLVEVLALSVAWSIRETWSAWVWLADIFFVDELALQTWVAVAGLLVPVVGILCVVQAYLRAERSPGARAYEGPAVLPALASVCIPGWGQIINGQLGKAVLFLSCWTFGLYVVGVSRLQPGMWTRIDPSGSPIAGVHLSTGALVALGLAALGWVLAVYDASLTARGRNDGVAR